MDYFIIFTKTSIFTSKLINYFSSFSINLFLSDNLSRRLNTNPRNICNTAFTAPV